MAKDIPTQDEYVKMAIKAAEAAHPFLGRDMPDLGNKTPGELIDSVGPMRIFENDFKKVSKILNGVIDSKFPQAELEQGVKGEVYEMTLTPVTQRRLSTELATAMILKLGTEKDLQACMVDLDMSQHRYAKLPEQPKVS